MKKAALGSIIIFLLFLSAGCDADRTPPDAAITAPVDNATVCGTVSITVDATDNIRIARVEFAIDSVMAATDTAAPWTYDWNTAGLSDSSLHTIIATAYDQADNTASDTVTVLYWTNRPPHAPSNPAPADSAVDQPLVATLAWRGGDPDSGDGASYAVFLGTTANPPLFRDSLSDTTCRVDTLATDTRYYWQVVAHDKHGVPTAGPVWTFTTTTNHPPTVPSNPSPLDGAVDRPSAVTLGWSSGDPDAGDTVRYTLYFGTTALPEKVDSNLAGTTYPVSRLTKNTTYYWKVVARDNRGDSTAGPLWSFTTLVEWPEVEILYDDDWPDLGWYKRANNPHTVQDNTIGWAVRMTPPSYPFTLTRVKFFFSDAAYNFYLHVWDDNGVSKKPGTDLLHRPYSIDASSVSTGDWWIHDVTDDHVTIAAGDVYVGFCHGYLDTTGAPTVGIRADTSAPIDSRSWSMAGGAWTLFSQPPLSDLMIRAVGYIGGKSSPGREIEIIGEPAMIHRDGRDVFIERCRNR